MQDAVIHTLDIGDGNSLFAVFDGHGGNFNIYLGPEVSKYVSQIFVNILKGTKQYKDKKYADALDITFMKVDEQIISPEGARKLKQYRGGQNQYGGQSKVSSGTGCTANVVLITPDKYIVANAGDSRSSLCRKSNALDLSFDHKPENPEERRRIESAGGSIQMGRVNGGLNLSRSFGDFDYKQNPKCNYAEQMITCKPDIKEVGRSNDDEFIIIGCDGIWEKYVDNSQGLINLIRDDLKANNNDLKKVTEGLLDHLLARDTTEGLGCDNMSAILLMLK